MNDGIGIGGHRRDVGKALDFTLQSRGRRSVLDSSATPGLIPRGLPRNESPGPLLKSVSFLASFARASCQVLWSGAVLTRRVGGSGWPLDGSTGEILGKSAPQRPFDKQRHSRLTLGIAEDGE